MAKAWKLNDGSQPDFPDDFAIARKAVLQVTDIKNNNNKYYGIELHTSPKGCRVFTHYGRTDDLENDPNAGAKESRYFASLGEAEAEYDSIYKQKTSKAKGYQEVSLASSKIGSQQARGQSSGHVDTKTLNKMASDDGDQAPKASVKSSTLPSGVQEMVKYIYAEATTALTTTVAAKITANGIETPLGVLTVGQVEKGEQVLQEIHQAVKAKASHSQLEDLSGEFYSAIPHRIGRTRDAIAAAVIDALADISAKQETLQLMKDMLAVNSGGKGAVLFENNLDDQYQALGVTIDQLKNDSGPFKEIEEHVLSSQVKSKNIKVASIYTLRRKGEWDVFDTKVGNEKLMFHGSRIKNWVGILSRGILMPKIVVSMGVNRTDAGWLGNGIYFGDASCTAAFYTTPGARKTRLMAIARVGLGNMKEYTKITYGLDAPPSGYDSCHGLRNRKGLPSQFEDDEYVIYRQNQQRLEYLVEFKA